MDPGIAAGLAPVFEEPRMPTAQDSQRRAQTDASNAWWTDASLMPIREARLMTAKHKVFRNHSVGTAAAMEAVCEMHV